jgi:tetratricopeptide (TPR) repeat protein
MMLDPKDARAVTIAGHVKAFLGRRLEEAATLHELAIQINPALPLAWHLYGITHAYAGRLGEAYAAVSRCRELAPDDPHGFYAEGALGIIHLLRGDHDSAIAIGRRVTERHPQFSSAYKSYLAALGHLGRKAEAADVLERLLKLEPRFSLQRFRAMAQYQRTQDLEHFITGLRLAGLT